MQQAIIRNFKKLHDWVLEGFNYSAQTQEKVQNQGITAQELLDKSLAERYGLLRVKSSKAGYLKYCHYGSGKEIEFQNITTNLKTSTLTLGGRMFHEFTNPNGLSMEQMYSIARKRNGLTASRIYNAPPSGWANDGLDGYPVARIAA